MAIVNPLLLMITVNVNGLNAPIKSFRVTEEIEIIIIKDPTIHCLK